MTNRYLPFNRAFLTGREFEYMQEAAANAHLRATARSRSAATAARGTRRPARGPADHSCTAALEMAALLVRPRPGDEVILPSFTFVSTANAFVLRGRGRCSSTSARTR